MKITELYRCNESIEVKKLPTPPQNATTYILNKKKEKVFDDCILSLAKPSNHQKPFSINQIYYKVVLRKYTGCFFCPFSSCNQTKPVISKKHTCHQHNVTMERVGGDCPFRMYQLIPNSNSSKLLVICDGNKYNHHLFPPEWRLNEETKKEIQHIFLENP